MHFHGVGLSVAGLDIHQIENSIAVVIVEFPRAVILFIEHRTGFLRAGLVPRYPGRDVHFYSAAAGVAGFDEDEVREVAGFCGDEEPGAISFEGECGAGFEDAGFEVGGCGGDVDFDGVRACALCFDVRQVGNAISVGARYLMVI